MRCATADDPGVDVVVGRQPIFDRLRRVFGYELLFRRLGGDPHVVGPVLPHGDLMTAQVIFGSVGIGIDRLVSDKVAFVNADRGLLTGSLPVVLPPERVVLEVLETVSVDPALLAGCRRLVAEGYTLALDDFVWFAGAERLLELASIVKIDLLQLDGALLGETIARCREFDVRLVAEKVETDEQLRECGELGMDYFQGYLLSRPDVVAGRSISPSSMARLELVASLMDEECEASKIESIVQREPAMTHQLLQLAGIGAAFGTRRLVRTLREAIVLFGTRRMASWAVLMMMIRDHEPSSEAVTTALVRARMCELVGLSLGRAGSQLAFTAGMIAAFDVLLGVKIEEALDTLPLAPDLRSAVLRDDSPIGRIVADVVDYQLGRLEGATRSDVGDEGLGRAWSDAMLWAADVTAAAA